MLTNSATSLELPLSDSLCTLDSSLSLFFGFSFDLSLSLGRFSLVADVFGAVLFKSVSMAVGVVAEGEEAVDVGMVMIDDVLRKKAVQADFKLFTFGVAWVLCEAAGLAGGLY